MRKTMIILQVYYYFGNKNSILDQKGRRGKFVINSGRYILIDKISHEQMEIKNIKQINKRINILSTMIEIKTQTATLNIAVEKYILTKNIIILDSIKTEELYNYLSNAY